MCIRDRDIAKEEAANPHLTPRMMHLEVHNEALAGKTLLQVRDFNLKIYI